MDQSTHQRTNVVGQIRQAGRASQGRRGDHRHPGRPGSSHVQVIYPSLSMLFVVPSHALVTPSFASWHLVLAVCSFFMQFSLNTVIVNLHCCGLCGTPHLIGEHMTHVFTRLRLCRHEPSLSHLLPSQLGWQVDCTQSAELTAHLGARRLSSTKV